MQGVLSWSRDPAQVQKYDATPWFGYCWRNKLSNTCNIWCFCLCCQLMIMIPPLPKVQCWLDSSARSLSYPSLLRSSTLKFGDAGGCFFVLLKLLLLESCFRHLFSFVSTQIVFVLVECAADDVQHLEVGKSQHHVFHVKCFLIYSAYR
jgi:hypothetical protein